jgi:hypothetical protein
MGTSSLQKESWCAIWLPRFASGSLLLCCLGFALHTSHHKVVLGKYSAGYATFLGALFFIVVPLFHWLARWCAGASELKSSSGRKLTVRPRHKLTAVVLAAGGVIIVAKVLVGHFGALKMTTFDPHIFHPFLQNVPTPNYESQHTNRWGFRGDDIEFEKGDDTFRIFVFGGSTVHCGTVPYEQTHCRVLEKRLRAAYPQYRIEVQNLGAEWHATEHDTIKLLFFAQDFSPDLAIMFHGINDLVRSLSPDMFAEGPYRSDYANYYGAVANLATGGRKRFLFLSAALGYWCSDLRFDQVRVEGPEGKGLNGVETLFYPKSRPVEITDWKSLPSFERNLRDFVAIARMKGFAVLLGTQASLYRNDLTAEEQQLLGFQFSHYFDGRRASLASMVEGMKSFNDATRRIAKEGGERLVDLDRLMPKTTAYLYDDVHYTKAGDELIGNAFAEEIVEWDVVEDTMRKRGLSVAGS